MWYGDEYDHLHDQVRLELLEHVELVGLQGGAWIFDDLQALLTDQQLSNAVHKELSTHDQSGQETTLDASSQATDSSLPVGSSNGGFLWQNLCGLNQIFQQNGLKWTPSSITLYRPMRTYPRCGCSHSTEPPHQQAKHSNDRGRRLQHHNP